MSIETQTYSEEEGTLAIPTYDLKPAKGYNCYSIEIPDNFTWNSTYSGFEARKCEDSNIFEITASDFIFSGDAGPIMKGLYAFNLSKLSLIILVVLGSSQ